MSNPDPNALIALHFRWAEALCRDGCTMPESVMREVRITAQWAEQVRTALGDRPMRVLSWYRCPAYNAKVGGAPQSQHLLGKAIDFVIKDVSPRDVQVTILIKGLWPKPIRGFGKYPGFTHIDRRTEIPATWEG